MLKNKKKTYPNVFFDAKLPKNCNQEKASNPFIYAGLQAYLPQQTLYLHPLPHGEPLKQPCNFLLENWHFLFENFNNLFLNCNKVMSNSLTMQFKLI